MHFSLCRSLIFIFVISSSMSCTVAQLTCGGGQSCSGPLCPNTVVQYMCNISVPLTFTRWTIPMQQCGGVNTTSLLLPQASGISCGSQTVICGPFMASNVPPNGDTQCTSSVLSITITSYLNGTLIACYNSDTNTQYLIGSATILVLSPPGPPSVSVVPGLNGLVVMWTSYGGGPAYYNITLVGAGISTSTNLTSTQFAGLPSDTLFSIAVVAINCAGYATTYVNTATLPLPPTNIRVQQVLLDTTTQLTITWTAVGGNVTGYQIMSSSAGYNVTASPLAKDSCLGSDCVYNQIVKTTGALYTVTMASINGGGVGPWSDPVQDTGVTNQQTSAVSVGVGVGIGLGVPILIIAVTMAMLFYWLYSCHHATIYVPGPSVQEVPLVTLELRLYATQWHEKPPGYDQSHSIPVCILSELNGCVLEMKSKPEDGHHVVINDRRDYGPPLDSQQWYLINQSDDGTFLIVSKLNGKVLSCESGEKPSKDSVLWKKDGDHIRSVPRENYVLGISGGHREPGYPVVLCGMKKDDMGQMFVERPAIVPIYYIECQMKCSKTTLPIGHDSSSCTECNRCVQITDTAIVMGTPYTSQSTDDQRWYIEYLHGQSDGSFLIISKLNGKALYCKGGSEGLEVKAAERNDEDESQHWKRDGSYIMSKQMNEVFWFHPYSTILNDKNTSQSTDDQQWYIKYLRGLQLDGSFLIISKLNGKALYCKGGKEGLKVKAAERNDEDESQHWKRDGSYIVSKQLNKVFWSQPSNNYLILNDKHVDATFLDVRQSDYKDRVTFAIKNCSTYYIQHHNDDRVLDLEHEANGSVSKANGAAAVFNPKAATPTDSQQWYLHPLSNGHYLVVSWLHGKVLTYQVGGGGHTKCFVSNSNGGEDQVWKKEKDGSIASVKYPYVVGRCVNITKDDM